MAFFDALLGKGGPSPNDTYAAQQAALQRGKRKAIGSYRQGLTEAEGVISPYMQGGRRGQELYENSLGVGGPEGYRRAYETFQGDPFLAGSEAAAERDVNRLFARYNSRGRADAGPTMAAIADASMSAYDRRVNAMRDRWQGLGGQGLGLAQFGAGLKYGTGTKIGDTEYGYGYQNANLMVNRDNALREQSSRGVNNLLASGGLGVKAAGLFI